MSYTYLWIHLVWATKNRQPFLTKSVRSRLFRHMITYARNNGIYLHIINGYLDHVHCLLRLHPSQNIADVAKRLKGESSFWLNQQDWMDGYFRWQNQYYATSVGRSELSRVRKYIRDQESHHGKREV